MAIFFRVHWSDCPAFSAENAESAAWGMHGDDESVHSRGYSCFANPGRLVQYFSARGGAKGEQVIVFAGDYIACGDDGEDLAIPGHVITTLSWEKFAAIFSSNETIYDAVLRHCRDLDIDAETAEIIATRDLDGEEAIRDFIHSPSAFLSQKNAEWNE